MFSATLNQRRLATRIFCSLIHFWFCSCLILFVKILDRFLMLSLINFRDCFEASRTKFLPLPFKSIFSGQDPDASLFAVSSNAVVDIVPIIFFFNFFHWKILFNFFIYFNTMNAPAFFTSCRFCVFSPITTKRTRRFILTRKITPSFLGSVSASLRRNVCI